MKKRNFYLVVLSLAFCIIMYKSDKSFASGGSKLIDKLDCKNSQGTVVSHGASCVSGDSNCIDNPCPSSTHMQ